MSEARENAADVFDNIGQGTGCTPSRLCPQDPLPRWAMAVWLVRTLDGRDPPRSGSSRFADVESWRWWSPHVERLADLGITRGCRTGPARFCPHRPVSRAQTASFLQRAFRLSPAPSAGFTDTGGNTHVGLNPLSGWYRSFHLNNAGHAEVARLLSAEIEATFEAPPSAPRP